MSSPYNGSEPALIARIEAAVNPLFRKSILAATHNPAVAGIVRRYGMRLGASRFVAGETFDECVPVLRRLNEQGLQTNTTLLGEGVTDEAAIEQVVESYERILEQIAEHGLRTNIALKLTHLGLDISEELAYTNVERIVDHASWFENFIRIDMEESGRVDPTLRIYRRLREAGHDNVGTVLQSYLYRTRQDLHDLMEYRPNLRLVKGAYLEPEDVAYPHKDDVDVNYLRIAKYNLAHGGYTAIATHDERIIEFVIEYARRNNIGAERFEFQMLYGIRPQLQRDLVDRGYKVLVATPFGPEWYPYLMRRLAERPANAFFFLRNLVAV